MNWIAQAFSDAGQPSSSRLMTLVHSVFAMLLMANYSYHNHGAIPDMGSITALGGYVMLPYGINRFSQPKGNGAPANGQ